MIAQLDLKDIFLDVETCKNLRTFTKGGSMKNEIRVIKEITPRMLSVDETAKYIGLATKTIRNRIGRKATKPFPIKPKRIGSRVLFDIKDLDAYLDKLQTT
jgi:predicted DNA-binding transcriptional regulator AlpA